MVDENGQSIGIIGDLFGHLSRAIGQEIEFELGEEFSQAHDLAKKEGQLWCPRSRRDASELEQVSTDGSLSDDTFLPSIRPGPSPR